MHTESARGADAPRVALAASLFWAIAGASFAAPAAIAPDGTVSAPAMDIPPSKLMSPELNASRIEHILRDRALAGKPIDESNAASFGPRLELSKQAYPVNIRAEKIGGVPVLVYEPKEGIAPEMQGRVLINVHGGGFTGCFVECGGLESVPIASLAKVRIISIDYREGPKFQFPAASEDVAAVYREVLKSIPANRVGIFGCSAGGTLTAQSLAWFQKYNLPTPAAAGIFCAGAGDSGGGDSQIIGTLLGDAELRLPQPVAAPGAAPAAPRGYLATAAQDDVLAYPGKDVATLAKFPPTLVIAGSRDFAFSSAINLHRRLVANGVDARLHVWEGGRHAFFYDPRPPESREAHAVIADFFKQRLK